MMTEFEYVTAADDGSQWMVHDELSLYYSQPNDTGPGENFIDTYVLTIGGEVELEDGTKATGAEMFKRRDDGFVDRLEDYEEAFVGRLFGIEFE